jgi:hypothetical protein
MNYNELTAELTAKAEIQGFTVVYDYIDSINEKESKTYPSITFYPIKSTHDFDADKRNVTYTLDGFTGSISHTFQELQDKLKAFVISLSGLYSEVEIQRIPRVGNDRLKALKFSFKYTVTEC